MNIYAVSDLHLSVNNPKPMNIFGSVWDNYLSEIEDSLSGVSSEDVILLSGDLSWAMTLEAALPDLRYLGGWKGRKVIIRGNHDYWWKSISGVRNALPQGIYALQNDCIRFGNFIVCGTRGWTTPENFSAQSAEDKKIYDRELLRLELSLKAMAEQRKKGDRVLLMLHYPPFNSRFEPSPFTAVIDRYEIETVVYGHLHGKDSRVRDVVTIGNTSYILTSCDLIHNSVKKIAQD